MRIERQRVDQHVQFDTSCRVNTKGLRINVCVQVKMRFICRFSRVIVFGRGGRSSSNFTVASVRRCAEITAHIFEGAKSCFVRHSIPSWSYLI
jgi:hypothetical protein